jgi:hypothetical protein
MVDVPDEQWPEAMDLLAEALGKASAALAVQTVMTATLIARGILSADDAATGTAAALAFVRAQELPADALEMAEAAIRGFAAFTSKAAGQH